MWWRCCAVRLCQEKTLLKLLLTGIFGPGICLIFKNITFEASLTIRIKPRLRHWSHRVLSVLSISSHYYFVVFWRNFMENIQIRFDTHGSVHRRLLSRNTNKMQLCNRIYYSKAYWRLSMFRTAGTPLIIRSSNLYSHPLVYMPMWWRAVSKAEWEMISHSALETAGHHMST